MPRSAQRTNVLVGGSVLEGDEPLVAALDVRRGLQRQGDRVPVLDLPGQGQLDG